MTYIRQGANRLTSNLPTGSFPFKKCRGRLQEKSHCQWWLAICLWIAGNGLSFEADVSLCDAA